jgi:ribosomal protein L11 methylase PrmA
VSQPRAEPGSFRDPKGRIFLKDGRVFRTIMPTAVADYEFVRDTGLLQRFAKEGIAISAEPVDPHVIGCAADGATYVLEHPRLPFISYPYEWSFPVLKAAALLHLDVQLKALEVGIALSDASAYNIQFVGTRPIFIDYLSFCRYREGEFWFGHRQFCEQFLNPLLLRSILGVAHNAWYRGNQEGISTGDLARLMPLRRRLSWNVLTQVVLPALLQRSVGQKESKDVAKSVGASTFPKKSYQGMIEKLHTWIARLQPADTKPTVWSNYADKNTYLSNEVSAKIAFIADFAATVKPNQLWDIGCNTGDYSKVALDAGAASVIGFDYDHATLERAFVRAQAENLNFLPLYLDAANPSPSQGWVEAERMGIAQRKSADALISLAFVHHMAITRNIPLDQLVDWLIGFAPHGVIEFVPKADPMVQDLLRLREDIFPNYTEEHFLTCVGARATIVRCERVTESGRTLVWYRCG